MDNPCRDRGRDSRLSWPVLLHHIVMNEAAKEYGQLTADQFKALIAKLPEIRTQDAELADVVRAVPKDRLNDMLPKDYAWAAIYEMSFVEHLAMLLLALDKLDFITKAAQAPDPAQAALDGFDSAEDEEWTGGWNGVFEKKHLVGLVMTLQRTLFSIMLYQKTMSSLVEEVRQGNDDSLFDAVRVDRSAVACPTIAARICRAELTRNKHFFIRLGKALKGPSKKLWQSYQDLRYALYALRELGFDRLSDDQLENLLVHQLKVYPNTYNARRNLRKQYALSKKINHLK